MDSSPPLIPCIGCRALVSASDGPTFRYPDAASPGCWAVFGEILAREYSDANYWRVHRLTVDAYAVQHPGRPTPQTIQSANVHLIALCCTLERDYSFERSTRLMQRAVERHKGEFAWLEPPAERGAITVLDVVQAGTPAEHATLVTRWARSVWEAWAAHHPAVRAWVDRVAGG